MNWLLRFFTCSAGMLLLFVASALFLVNLTIPDDIAPINDPLFHLPLPQVFWIGGGIALATGVVCLFARNNVLRTTLVALAAIIFLGCRLSVSAFGFSDGFQGYLGGVGNAFHIRSGTADALLVAVSLYLLVGNFALGFGISKHKESNGPWKMKE